MEIVFLSTKKLLFSINSKLKYFFEKRLDIFMIRFLKSLKKQKLLGVDVLVAVQKLAPTSIAPHPDFNVSRSVKMNRIILPPIFRKII